jgi:DNA-binding NarL/FixJ family response regulator
MTVSIASPSSDITIVSMKAALRMGITASGSLVPIREVLSPREIEVIQTLCCGVSNKEIGRRLGLAENTIKQHFKSISKRIGFFRRDQIILWALTQGFRNGLAETVSV